MSVMVPMKSSGGITFTSIESRLFLDRQIYLENKIEKAMACDFDKQISLLVKEDKNLPIDVYICGPGGDVDAGLYMYDVIQGCSTPIRLFCRGKAYSMAALLFASGKHGRYILPHAKMMLHEPFVNNQAGGSASSIRALSESLMDAKKVINEILVKHTGRTKEEIEAVTGFENYFSAEEAVKFGLADKILNFGEEPEV